MTPTATGVCALTVETSPLEGRRELLPFLDPRHPLLWTRTGRGLAGRGTALRLEFTGPNRIRGAARAWREICGAAHVVDRVGAKGSGLVAFGAFCFDDDSEAASVLVVPETVLGTDGVRSWITHIRPSDAPDTAATPSASPYGDEYRLTLLPGALSPQDYCGAVEEALDRIESGAVGKVVLARDLTGHVPHESDLRLPLVRLASRYSDCWTYAVDGFLGSSPETLVHVQDGAVDARVLAGTVSRGADADLDRAAIGEMTSSAKTQEEHDLAVQSVLGALGGHTHGLAWSPEPYALKLPNLWHLATDLHGLLTDGSSSLDLAAALHPTAAVGGSPTVEAVALIRELEPFDRGRYAGPIGWVDGDGDGEWAIALRGAQVSETGDLHAYAGAGIVRGSDPQRELDETTMKLRPIVEAFG